MPSYKSYCWSLGTTSFRTVEFNRKIEQQLKLLNDFWAIPQYQNQNWSANNALQVAYYEFIKAQGFIADKDAPRKDKDAREKTSGLVDLGLINGERRLTPAGQTLLDIARNGNFDGNNLLQIPADSFIYFKQLLKLNYQFEDEYIRPYIVLAYLLVEFGELSKEEFTYLLPLATTRSKLNMLIRNIKEIRAGNSSIDEGIENILFSMDNYKEAQEIFVSSHIVNETLLQEIGMNRKSRDYDTPYFRLYSFLHLYKNNPTTKNALALLSATNDVSGNARIYWKKYIFKKSFPTAIEKEGTKMVNDIPLFHTQSESEFRKELFRLIHLFKAKSLLDDYYDLNKRYFKTSDTVLFKDDIVKFDIIPNCYFSLIKDSLLDIAFTKATDLFNNTSLADIGVVFDIRQEQLFEKAEELYGVQVRNLYDIQGFVDRERYARLNQMIDEKFTDEILIKLMTHFEKRDDKDIQALVTNNADVPTIFEYVLAIAWYKISGRQGKVLEYMNLSLDADLLPITHAAGGHEDITYKYGATESYPAHTLLIEATLAGGTNQRRMEMEPVSRHLGDYLLNHTEETYCVFATTFLHVNVVADFRGRKFMPYYSSDGTRSVNGMKIVPCNTEEIKTIIQRGITYAQLYKIFEEAHQANTAPNLWYDQEIKNKL